MKENNTGIANLEKDATMHIYPNPTSDILNIIIDWEKPESCTITVYDITGRVCIIQNLEKADHTQKKLDVSKLPAGSYYLKVANAQGQMAKTFHVLK